MTKPRVEFKKHTPEGSNTVDLTLRVSQIGNGWVLKAGGPPFFCGSRDELLDNIEDVISRFTGEDDE